MFALMQNLFMVTVRRSWKWDFETDVHQLINESVPVKEAWYTFNFESYRIREGVH